MSGFLEASDGASIHRFPPGNVGFPKSIRWGEHPSLLQTYTLYLRNASCANEFELFSGCSHLPILILHSLSGLLCRLLRAWRELKRNLPQRSLKRKKRASSEMSPLIAAHVFSWAWRYHLGIMSADAFARDLAASCERRTKEVLDQVVSSVAATTKKHYISQKMLHLPHFSALGRATKALGEIRRPDQVIWVWCYNYTVPPSSAWTVEARRLNTPRGSCTNIAGTLVFMIWAKYSSGLLFRNLIKMTIIQKPYTVYHISINGNLN